MTNNTYFESNVNLNNESKRLPVVFCLDISPSMKNYGRIAQLNLALNGFIEELQVDARTKKAAEIAIVTFCTEARVILDFQEAGKMVAQQISAEDEGATYMGTGILKALDLIKIRRGKYIKAGFGGNYYLPYLIVITDGNPEFEPPELMTKAVNIIDTAYKSKKADDIVLTFPIGVGDNVKVEQLQRLAAGFLEEPIIYDDATEFSDLFKVLSGSIYRSIDFAHSDEDQMKDIKNIWHEKLKNIRKGKSKS